MIDKLRSWLIGKCGGFRNVDEAIEAIKEKDSKDKYRILTLAVKKLFNTIGSDDILQVHESGQWLYQGRTLGKEEIEAIIAEATYFSNTRLWKVLETDIKYQANRKMFILSKTEDDLVAGKLWVYMLDAFKTRIESIKAGSAKFNHKDK